MNPSNSLPDPDAPSEPLGRFFLFAGADATPGGLSDLVSVFFEAGARAAFATVRLQQDRRAEWAELAAVDAQGSIRLLCWFGHDGPVPHHDDSPAWLPPGLQLGKALAGGACASSSTIGRAAAPD